MTRMKDVDIAWLAGIIDGEGSILLRGKTGVSVTVTMTDEDIIRRLHKVTGVGQVSGPWRPAGGRKDAWNWSLNRAADVARILLAIYPMMGERRQQRIAEAADYLAACLLIPHGTDAGYTRELRAGRASCAACRGAHAAAKRRQAHLRHEAHLSGMPSSV